MAKKQVKTIGPIRVSLNLASPMYSVPSVNGNRVDALTKCHLWAVKVRFRLLSTTLTGELSGDLVFDTDIPCNFKEVLRLAKEELIKLQDSELPDIIGMAEGDGGYLVATVKAD